MSEDSFLPENYTPPTGNYTKLKDGENRLRILSSPILGWLDFIDNKPVRTRMSEPKPRPHDPTKKVKHFWAMVVWNYAEGKIQVWEPTQSGIQSAITNLAKDQEWGNPREYDIKVTKKGSGMETEYSVVPSPKKKVDDNIIVLLSDVKVNLDELYSGGDPLQF